MPRSTWLKEYYSRITEEYHFSMNRKDTLTNWAITIEFVTFVAYVELLRENSPSFWRICLLVALLCFIIRFFCHSCLAYTYLKKWRYLLDQIEKYWMTNVPSLEKIEEEINRYHHTPRTTEKRLYFVKGQLMAGFLLLFLFPSFIILFELFYYSQEWFTIVPISWLILYCMGEYIGFVKYEHLKRGT